MTERDRQFAYEQERARLRQEAYVQGFDVIGLSTVRINDACVIRYSLFHQGCDDFWEDVAVSSKSWTAAFERAHKRLRPTMARILAEFADENSVHYAAHERSNA